MTFSNRGTKPELAYVGPLPKGSYASRDKHGFDKHECGEGFRHDCIAAGPVEIAEDWRFCPWCSKKTPTGKAKCIDL